MVQAALSQLSRQIGQRSSEAMARARVGWGELLGLEGSSSPMLQ